jgi:hypothetical protein
MSACGDSKMVERPFEVCGSFGILERKEGGFELVISVLLSVVSAD